MEKLAPPAFVSKELPAGIVDVLFVLLDVDGDGCLDQEEFMTLMKRQSAIPDPVRTFFLPPHEVSSTVFAATANHVTTLHTNPVIV